MSGLQKKLVNLKKTLNKFKNLNKSLVPEDVESEFGHNRSAIEHYEKQLAQIGDITDSSPKTTKIKHNVLSQNLKEAKDRENTILEQWPDLRKPKAAQTTKESAKSPYPQDEAEFQQHLDNRDPKDLPGMYENVKNYLKEAEKDPLRNQDKIAEHKNRLNMISNKIDYHKNKRPFLELHDQMQAQRARRDNAHAKGDTEVRDDAEEKINKLQDKIDLIPPDDLRRELSRHEESADPDLSKYPDLFNQHRAKSTRLEDQIKRANDWNTPDRKARDAYKKQLDGLSAIDKNSALRLFDEEKNAKKRGLTPSGTDKSTWKQPSNELKTNEGKFKVNEQDVKRQKIKQQEAKIASVQALYDKELDPTKKNQYKNHIDNLSSDLEDFKSQDPIKREKLSDTPQKDGKKIGEKQRIVSQVGHNEDGQPHNVARIYSWEQGEDGKPSWQLKEEKSDNPKYHISGHRMIAGSNRADLSDRSKYDENGVPVTQYENGIAIGDHDQSHSYTTVSKDNPVREDGQPNEIVRHFKFNGKDKKWNHVRDTNLSNLYDASGKKIDGTEGHADLSDRSMYDEHGAPISRENPKDQKLKKLNELLDNANKQEFGSKKQNQIEAIQSEIDKRRQELKNKHEYKAVNPLYPVREDGQPNVIKRIFNYQDLGDGIGYWRKHYEENEDADNFHPDGTRKSKVERDQEIDSALDRIRSMHGIDPKRNLSDQKLKPKYKFSDEEKAQMEIQEERIKAMSPEQKADLIAQSNLISAKKQAQKDIGEKQQKEAYDQGKKQLDPSMEIRRTGNRTDRSNMGQENQLISDEEKSQQRNMSQPSATRTTSQVVQNPPKPKMSALDAFAAAKQSVTKPSEAETPKPKTSALDAFAAAKNKVIEVKKSDVKKLDNLKKTLNELKKAMNNAGIGGTGSVKAGAVLPNITPKGPKLGHNSLASKVKIPSATNQSKKDPMRSVQQIQNKDIKDLKMKEAAAALVPMIKFEKNGQWSLYKADDETPPPIPTDSSETPPPIPAESMESNVSTLPKQRTSASEGRTPGPEYWEYPDPKTSSVPKSTIDRWNDEAEAFYVHRKKQQESEPKEQLASSADKYSKNKLKKKKRCWKGYEPTPGKKPYSDGSCQPMKKEECDCKSKAEKECGCDE